MTFQAELEIFKINLKIVFIFISSELGSSTKCDQLKNFRRMHSNDIITNNSSEFHANSVNTIISMQTKHEILLVISVIDSFCAYS